MRPLKCPHGPILTNVTLRHELRAGKFSRLGMAADMDTCIQMCCERDDCEMAFMPGKHCYGVDCFSQKHCEITTLKPGNLTVKIAAVRPIAVNPAKDQIAGVLNIYRYGKCAEQKWKLLVGLCLGTAEVLPLSFPTCCKPRSCNVSAIFHHFISLSVRCLDHWSA